MDELFKDLDAAEARTKRAQSTRRYTEELAAAVRDQFLRPDALPSASCLVKIVQKPGGWVQSTAVDPSCPYDTAGKRAVEDAVLRAQPLPYEGYESVFSRTFEFTFDPNFPGVGK